MPELPEVETLRRSILSDLIGLEVLKIKFTLLRIIDFYRQNSQGKIQAVKSFSRNKFSNLKVTEILRRGKYLIIELESNYSVIIHLGMSGQIFIKKNQVPYLSKSTRLPGGYQLIPKGQFLEDRHVHFEIIFKDKKKLLFRDPRTFGKIILVSGDWSLVKRISKLGVEPLTMNIRQIIKKFPSSRRNIKSLLLNQGFICGIGNIYADESLFDSGIQPTKTVSQLSLKEKNALLLSIKKILKKGLRNFGTTFNDFRDGHGVKGKNQESLLVYSRAGKPCLKCKKILKSTTLSGRTTVWCDVCQN